LPTSTATTGFPRSRTTSPTTRCRRPRPIGSRISARWRWRCTIPTDRLFAGELVYTTAGDGTNRVYVSLQSDNEDNPATATAYDATVTYQKNDVVTSASIAYMSLIDLNLANTPASSPRPGHRAPPTRRPAVTGSDGVRYTSVGAGNIGNDPTTDGGVNWTNTGILTPWTIDFTAGTGSLKWRQIGGAEFPMGVGLSELNIIYPLGTGPSTQSTSRNIFKLPSGFLRIANQNPKPGTPPARRAVRLHLQRLGARERLSAHAETGPIPYRFVANVTDVARMDPMFCEGGPRASGWKSANRSRSRPAKLGTIAKIYDEWMSKARHANAIEQGPEDSPDDDFVTCRL
jgi:hypothetical protein